MYVKEPAFNLEAVSPQILKLCLNHLPPSHNANVLFSFQKETLFHYYKFKNQYYLT